MLIFFSCSLLTSAGVEENSRFRCTRASCVVVRLGGHVGGAVDERGDCQLDRVVLLGDETEGCKLLVGFAMVVTNEELPFTLYRVRSSVSQQQPSSSAYHAEHNHKDSEMAKLKKKRERTKSQKERQKQRKVTDPKFRSKNMDPEVWGNLPPSLTLEIYKKLPLQSFYQLREVCNDWNLVARERRCVTDPLHKRYFLLIHRNDIDDESVADDDSFLHGILSFHIASGTWRWKKLHAISHNEWLLYQPFSVKGLTFSTVSRSRNPTDSLSRHPKYQVFDAHTRKRYNIPHQPKTSEIPCALGMTVDTSVVPHTFKIILGSPNFGTQIYNSVTQLWETRSSLLVSSGIPMRKTCLHSGNCMYIWCGLNTILVYSLEEDKWSNLKPPLAYMSDSIEPRIERGLGSWQGL